MRESIKTEVIVKDNESTLEFEYDDDVVTCFLDGKEIFRLDYDLNLKIVIERVLELWNFEIEED